MVCSCGGPAGFGGSTGPFGGKSGDPACLTSPDPSPALMTQGTGFRYDQARAVYVRSGSTAVDLAAFQEAHRQKLFDTGAVDSFGRGVCESSACFHLYVHRCTDGAASLLRTIENWAPDGAMTIQLAWQGSRGPRCKADDPKCGPEPYSSANRYRMTGKRRAPVQRTNPYFSGFSGGACEHDGECRAFGCGNHCLSWTHRSFVGTCEGYTRLDPTFCGCVNGGCTWFDP